MFRAAGQNPSMAEFNRGVVDAELVQKQHFNYDDCHLLAQHTWTDENHRIVLDKSMKRISKHETFIEKNEFRELMMNKGERLNQQEFDELCSFIGVTHDGKINHAGKDFCICFFVFICIV
jgi:Ca2+-binding EF-hand superfamily protein